ncbi:1696_t:CDS:1, partial [Acaulospora colombiana]
YNSLEWGGILEKRIEMTKKNDFLQWIIIDQGYPPVIRKYGLYQMYLQWELKGLEGIKCETCGDRLQSNCTRILKEYN